MNLSLRMMFLGGGGGGLRHGFSQTRQPLAFYTWIVPIIQFWGFVMVTFYNVGQWVWPTVKVQKSYSALKTLRNCWLVFTPSSSHNYPQPSYHHMSPAERLVKTVECWQFSRLPGARGTTRREILSEVWSSIQVDRPQSRREIKKFLFVQS